MPLYDYQCSNCGHELCDVKQSIHDKPKVRCPQCNKHKLERVVHGGLMTIVKEVKTIGQLADSNYKANKSKIDEEHAKKAEIKEKQEAKDRPWYHDKNGPSRDKINKMTPLQKQRYVMEGKT